jgi:cold shock CspA family protein
MPKSSSLKPRILRKGLFASAVGNLIPHPSSSRYARRAFVRRIFIFRRFMRGQVEFFDAERKSGFIILESHEKIFFSGRHWLGDAAVIRNQWVEFRLAPYSDGKSRSAIDIFPIDCPQEHLLYGEIRSFLPEKHFGFIDYRTNGQTQSIFFHCSDLMRVDGVEPVPSIGSKVSFCFGEKTDRPIACQIWIEQRPDFEKTFLQAPELPLDVQELVPTTATQEPSVLAKSTKNLSLIEIMNRRRREGIQ